MNYSGNLRRRNAGRFGSRGRKHIVATQSFVGAQQSPAFVRELLQRSGFAGHHVLVKFRRTADGLAGVGDDEIEAGPGDQHGVIERIDGRRMAEVGAKNFEAVGTIPINQVPAVEVRPAPWKTGWGAWS